MSVTDSSVIVRGMRAIGRALRSLDEGLARAAAERKADDGAEAARVRAIVADSRFVRLLDRMVAAPGLAWQHSQARRIVTSAAGAFNALELPQRVRLLGWMIVVAVATRAVIYVLAGNALTSSTLAVWALVAAVGTFMMVAARSVAVAWVEWRRRRS